MYVADTICINPTDSKNFLGCLESWVSHPEIKCGNLVLLAEDNFKPLQWKICRVIEVYAGKDSVTRVVKVKTSVGEIIRPVVKLRKLPIEEWFPCVFVVHRLIINIYRSRGAVC